MSAVSGDECQSRCRLRCQAVGQSACGQRPTTHVFPTPRPSPPPCPPPSQHINSPPLPLPPAASSLPHTSIQPPSRTPPTRRRISIYTDQATSTPSKRRLHPPARRNLHRLGDVYTDRDQVTSTPARRCLQATSTPTR